MENIQLKRATLSGAIRKEPSPSPRRKERSFRQFFKRHKIPLLVLGIVCIALLFWMKTSSSSAFEYVFGGPSLPQSNEGRVNILLLGMGGGKHEGATLTDTIMVAGYDPETHRVDLISLPRDMWIDKHKEKVNAIYQMGLENGGGLKFAEAEIGEILGTEIPYAVTVDFSGFVKAVDLIGGIDANVETTFDDYEYPIEGKEDDLCGFKEQKIEVDESKSKELHIPTGKQTVYLAPDGKIATDSAQLDFSCRYEHIHYDKGSLHMDGVTALKFVRSRHGNNGEGSDFARSKRQQVVIQAFRQKVLSIGTLLDPTKIVSLLQTLGDSISTDIPQTKFLQLINAFKEVSSVTSHVIDQSSEEHLLVHPDPSNYGGAWVLVPAGNNYAAIHKYVDDVFSGNPISTPSASPSRSGK